MSVSIFRLPASASFSVKQALEHSLNDDLQDVLIAGYSQEGTLIVRSSKMSRAEAMFLAVQMQRWAQSGGLDK